VMERIEKLVYIHIAFPSLPWAWPIHRTNPTMSH
jgi:hypothetical protein